MVNCKSFDMVNKEHILVKYVYICYHITYHYNPFTIGCEFHITVRWLIKLGCALFFTDMDNILLRSLVAPPPLWDRQVVSCLSHSENSIVYSECRIVSF